MKILSVINKNKFSKLAGAAILTTALSIPVAVNSLVRSPKSDNFAKVENIQSINEIEQNSSNTIHKNNEKIILTTLLRDMEICPFSFDRENEFADIFLSYDLVNLPIPLDGSLKRIVNHTGGLRFNTEKNFKYDSQGRLIEISHQKPIEWDTNKKYSYNSSGQIDAIYHGKGFGKWDTSRTHKYNKNGELTNIKHEKSPLEWDTSREFEYDKQGRLVKIHSNTTFGDFDRDVLIKYGANGKISEARHCRTMEFDTKTKYEYDNKNRLSKMTYVTKPTEFNISKVFKYNNKGQLIKIENKMPPMEWNTSTEFEYDSKGRLTLIKHNTPPGEFNQKTEFVWE